jgi:hypothetical protein
MWKINLLQLLVIEGQKLREHLPQSLIDEDAHVCGMYTSSS